MKLLTLITIFFLMTSFIGVPLNGDQSELDWYKNGDKAYAYDFITQNIEKKQVLHLRSNQESVKGWGTIMKNISSKPFKGRKVKFTASVKTEDIKGWVGLWMRVADSQTNEIYAYENMIRHAIKNTQDWKDYSITLEVDPDSDIISYGILLNEAGKVWMKDTKIEVFTGVAPAIKVNKTR
ncbi:hypothetical protein OKW21_006409 [Catalinimonas alkaloidigena]|uniref:hypothetical protein n=1 Tax=Catalinimonas alkaloidigena TaxID=1075417 RepID=UPI0024054832|nr:hypothetical protein [Catalinimonas alkaloidigena]MDF9801146.1 hypothetical protein [Catalinimonas alkaloidigena]